MTRPRRIEAYAIVSTDGMLANAAGIMPEELKFDADQRFFAQGLDFSGHTGQPAGIDISGAWYPLPFQDSGLITASGSLAEYGGIPLNEAGRLYALAWNPSRIQGRQHQCMGYVVPYTYNQPGNLRFWEERDPDTQPN